VQEPAFEFGREVGGAICEADDALIFGVPLELVCGDVVLAFGEIFQNVLPGREGLYAVVAHQPDVDFAPLDVLLGDGVGVRLAVYELDALRELLVVANDGRLRDADRAFVRDRLDEHGELQTLGPPNLSRDGEDDEGGDVYAMVCENFFRERLVFRESQAARVAARVPLLHQLKVADDVLVEERVAVELFEKIEGDVWAVVVNGDVYDAKLA